MSKWHLFNSQNCILYWKDKILEFDDYESAKRYIDSYLILNPENKLDVIEIRQSILYNISEDKILNATKIMKGNHIMKFHIYNANGIALFWDDGVLEFDTYDSAQRFLDSAIASEEHLEDFLTGATIRQDILFIDGGEHLNATNLIVYWNDKIEDLELKEII